MSLLPLLTTLALANPHVRVESKDFDEHDGSGAISDNEDIVSTEFPGSAFITSPLSNGVKVENPINEFIIDITGSGLKVDHQRLGLFIDISTSGALSPDSLDKIQVDITTSGLQGGEAPPANPVLTFVTPDGDSCAGLTSDPKTEDGHCALRMDLAEPALVRIDARGFPTGQIADVYDPLDLAAGPLHSIAAGEDKTVSLPSSSLLVFGP